MGTLVVFFFLAIVQQNGGMGMTFGTMEECVETQQQAAMDPQTLFISDCTELTLTPVPIPKENKP